MENEGALGKRPRMKRRHEDSTVRIDFGSPDFHLVVRGSELEKCEESFSRLFEKASKAAKKKKEERPGHYG